ncbi:hypothetical protein GF323_06670 [Candidatus Woesearchaeota archaeon]|nr:hypothetical protein [Candidatus Woesearchaeota archaeon]
MPYAVTHVLLTIIVLDLYRDHFLKNSKYFSLHTLLIGGIAGLLPDIDVPLGWVLDKFGYTLVHGSFTHTPWFASLFLIPALIFLQRKDMKKAALYFVIAFGVFFHVFLDWFLGGGMHKGVMLLFPFSFTAYRLHLLHYFNLGSLAGAGIDALILLAWLWHEEVKHKINDFI